MPSLLHCARLLLLLGFLIAVPTGCTTFSTSTTEESGLSGDAGVEYSNANTNQIRPEHR